MKYRLLKYQAESMLRNCNAPIPFNAHKKCNFHQRLQFNHCHCLLVYSVWFKQINSDETLKI